MPFRPEHQAPSTCVVRSSTSVVVIVVATRMTLLLSHHLALGRTMVFFLSDLLNYGIISCRHLDSV